MTPEQLEACRMEMIQTKSFLEQLEIRVSEIKREITK